ncbi:MAG: AraC family transcriptional regulator [Oscillospiraceae bacterium]|nr:AraC family transcriptional regulator [Oscillospiraceae bacterium]
MNRVILEGVLDGIVVDRVVRDEEFSMPSTHFHQEYEIYYLFEGERYFFIEDKTYPIHKGSLVIINAMQIHKTSAFGKLPHDRFLIEFSDEPFAAFLRTVCGAELQNLITEHVGVWELDERGQYAAEQLLCSIAKEVKEQKPHYQTIVMMKLAELLLNVTRFEKRGKAGAPASREAKHAQINGITDYISNNYDKRISLDAICKEFYISKSYLCRIFKDVTGSTVQEYIHMRRIKKSLELLEDNNMSVANVSASLGYGTLTHFERMFRKYTETTPLKYRKKMHLIRQKVRERKNEDLKRD